MKKITLCLFLLLFYVVGFSQIPIGNGTNEAQALPFDPFYGYTYSQSIYTSAEINASGDITGISWYFSGTTLLPNSQNITIYLGHSTRTAFASTSDWEALASLTQVYTGAIPVTGPGWVTVTFPTPFTYNGTDNLIVAVDENMASYDSSSDDFYNTSSTTGRSIYYRNDTTNPDPASPPTGNLVSFYPNVIFEGITQACPQPTNLVSSNLTSNSIDIAWTDPTGVQFDYEYVVQAQGTGMPTGSGTAVGDLMVSLNSLTPNTSYEFWVRAYCSVSDQSAWLGPLFFTTECSTYTVPSLENFSTYVPGCWQEADNGDLVAGPATFGSSTWVADGFGNVGSTGAARYNIYTTGANDWLLSPLYDIPAVGYELKFDAAATQYGSTSAPTTPWEADDYVEVLVSTGTTNWTVLYTYNNTNVPSNVGSANVIDLDAYSGQTVRFAFRVVEGAANGSADIDFSIDNFEIRLTPATAPDCATNVIGTPDASCGNFDNVLSWDAVSGADGYRITLGTTPSGNEVLDNVDLGSVLSYSFAGAINTMYYFTITPYNGSGNASGCAEATFTTNANGCYCVSNPSSNDGLGITNVQLVSTNFPTTDVTYFDHTATSVDMPQGLNNNVQITFATGYTYTTYILIDFNDDFDFNDAGELVFTGESLSDDPTTYNASFVMPGAAPLGSHRMRIVTADYLPTVDPCYSDTYGVTLDFTINIVAPSCSPPTFGTVTVVENCNASEYVVNVDITGLGSGSPSLTDGVTTLPVSATGVVQVGPYAFGSPVTLTILHGSDNICDVNVGTYNFVACPPANDDCANAEVLTPGGVFADNAVVGTNVAATASSGETAPGCASYLGGDVWYQVTVPASGSLTFENNTQTGGITDSAAAVYSGTCGALVLLGCNDSSSTAGDDHPLITVSGRTPGETLYYRVWEYSNDNFGEFQVSVYDASLSATAFELTNFMAYPNPVKDILNLEYTSNMTSVTVFNMIGQQVINQKVNATAAKINMTELNSGTYVVQVVIDGTTQVLKVVKE
ncbi:GEVED domain-containing protein [Flavobacterium sp. NRK F7]|uniref:GEVED domain-containing protein n=1 Tax=Flavobacterium sp. NRK F7 TaxID=2954930 RepID=UPI0020902FB9|nr:GEVED domain-containing protein [Flavobacterium sp. NRK F7]MCO6162933.1 T9SS type A sorting domain-containing protein [Flavobacterium sp. NRK F7]